MDQPSDGKSGSTPDGVVHSRFERHSRDAPDRVAVVAGAQTLTFGDLNRRANRVAWRLRELGVGPETLVGFAVDRSVAMVVGLLGILKAGGAYVPLDPGHPSERLAVMLGDTAAPVIVAERRLASLLPRHDAPVVLPDDVDMFDRYPEDHFRAFATVHTILFGGDSVRSELGARAVECFHGKLIHLYGPTETTGFATVQDVGAMSGDGTQVAIGRPISHAYVRILDGRGRPVPDGTAGELYVGGRGSHGGT